MYQYWKKYARVHQFFYTNKSNNTHIVGIYNIYTSITAPQTEIEKICLECYYASLRIFDNALMGSHAINGDMGW